MSGPRSTSPRTVHLVRMWLGPVNLPGSLVDAQARGALVVFAGAGVSMSPPANLPDFAQLVSRVKGSTQLDQDVGEPPDRFLGRLELDGVHVQQRTRELLDAPGSAPTPLHHDLLRLFPSVDDVKLVTTNFDRHFSTAAAEVFGAAPDTYVGPALPLGRETRGLVYLHGALGARSPLVLTDADFGRAYLTDGWARQFLVEMFQQYTVLFVGYSHDDPITGHLARSLPPGTARYAFTAPGREPNWRHLGITPVEYPRAAGPERHAELRIVARRWADHARMGVFDHAPRVRRLAAAPPPIDPETVDYVNLVVLRDPALTETFVASASAPVWLDWMDAQGNVDALFQRERPLSDVERRLAWWFAERFAVTHPFAALSLVRTRGARPHHDVGYAVLRTLADPKASAPASVLGAWTSVLLQSVPPAWYRGELTTALGLCTRREDAATALLLVEHLTRPQLALERPWPSLDAFEDTVDEPFEDVPGGGAEDATDVGSGGRLAAAVPSDGDASAPQDAAAVRATGVPLRLRGDVTLAADLHQFRTAWAGSIRPRLAELHVELLAIVTAHLGAAHRLYQSVGNADAQFDPWSIRRSAIEPHAQDPYPGSADLLIDLARELVEYVVHHAPSRADARTAEWYASPVVLLRRLAVHATAERPSLDADAAVRQVVHGRWLADGATKHEVFRLVARAFPRAAPALRSALIAHSMQPGTWVTRAPDAGDTPDAHAREKAQRIRDELEGYAQYNFAVWLAQSAPECSIAEAHLAAVHARNPEWEPREYPDLSSWSGGTVSRGVRSPIATDVLLAEDADARLEYLRTYVGDSDDYGDAPSRAGLLDAVRNAAEQTAGWGAALAGALARAGATESDLWAAVLAGSSAAEFDLPTWRAVLAVLDTTADLVETVPRAAADFVRRGVERRADGILADDVSQVERVADRAYTAVRAVPEIDARPADSWRHIALNHDAGRIAAVWLHALSTRVRAAGGVESDAWFGLPPDYRQRFQAVFADADDAARIATLTLAGQLRFLLAIDRAWTLAHVIPLFDWTRDAERAGQVFHGLLGTATLNDAVWDVLRPAYLAAFAHAAGALRPVRDGLVYDLVWAAVYGAAHPLDDGWLPRFIADADDETRVLWAEQVGRTLETLPVGAAAALWTRWVDRYWGDRITGVPRVLSAAEANAMVGWVLGLRAVLPAVVARVTASPVVHDSRDLLYFSLREDMTVVAADPSAVLTLVAFLLKSRTRPLYGDCSYVAEVVRAARGAGGDESAVRAVCERLAHLGCRDATTLLDGEVSG